MILHNPSVYLVGRQTVSRDGLDRFLADHKLSWETDTQVGAEQLCEVAGRVCYMSFGKGRKTNAEYMANIIGSAHGSVLEHAVWNFVITGVSRSFTHELVRHRAGFGYSQLSQRYVDETTADFVEPDCIAADDELHQVWLAAIEQSHAAYCRLVDGLQRKFAAEPDPTLRRKLARQAARSVLPNATETKIFVTANGRALRHFIEMRCSPHADVEMRKVANQIFEIVRKESPELTADYKVSGLPDGTFSVSTDFRKA